ncbi:unnamed protein product [Prorocentrum cordatum]|uniref:Uncharacterized protein n=1 Tax=Prorocentrum cordatum TaxID=2364126 RepID=A0ABN9SNQ2_9DINO|nr:unnamed protein product [Polarella glacialis]
MEALKEVDGACEKKDGCAGFSGEADENGCDGHDGDNRSDLAGIVDQLASLADEGDALMLGDAELEDEPEDGIYAEFKQTGRNFKDARDLIRRLMVARGNYPVLAPRPPAARGPRLRRLREPWRGARPGGGQETARDRRGMRCLACRSYGRQAKGCPCRNKTCGKPQPNETISFALPELGELVFLLDDANGIRAILGGGATRSLIGVTMSEFFVYDVRENFWHRVRRG